MDTPPSPNNDTHEGIMVTDLDVYITACLIPNFHVSLLRYVGMYARYFIDLV